MLTSFAAVCSAAAAGFSAYAAFSANQHANTLWRMQQRTNQLTWQQEAHSPQTTEAHQKMGRTLELHSDCIASKIRIQALSQYDAYVQCLQESPALADPNVMKALRLWMQQYEKLKFLIEEELVDREVMLRSPFPSLRQVKNFVELCKPVEEAKARKYFPQYLNADHSWKVHPIFSWVEQKYIPEREKRTNNLD